MVRQRATPQTYEEFSETIAGYRKYDRFDLDELAGEELSASQRLRIAQILGGSVVGTSVELKPATYGIHREKRQGRIHEIIRSSL